MDDHPDPIHQFFPSSAASTPNVLYTTLGLSSSGTATAGDVRKAYRKLALKHHPDKHAGKGQGEKEDSQKEFQRVGFAYAVLSDEARRKRYDTTGRTDESAFADAEAMGWDAYFESLFQRIDRKVLDEDKVKYQGSQDELDDLIEAYNSSSGSLPTILERIPHATTSDEPRLITLINDLISTGKLVSKKIWITTSTDVKAKTKRVKAAEGQAKEAEEAAKDLGVWDEFYGSGKKGKRQGDKDNNSSRNGDGGGADGLQALILKRQRDRAGAMDAITEKYQRLEEEEREKKRSKGKKKKVDENNPADMTDAEFEALQAKMFGKKGETGEKGKNA